MAIRCAVPGLYVVVILIRGDLGWSQPSQVPPIKGIDRIGTGAIGGIVAIIYGVRPRACALHQPPLKQVGPRAVGIRSPRQVHVKGTVRIGTAPLTAAVDKTQQMADFVGMGENPGELVDVVVVVAPAFPLPHHIAVADLTGTGGCGVCNYIHLGMQQAPSVSCVWVGCSPYPVVYSSVHLDIRDSRIQVDDLVAPAAGQAISGVGQILNVGRVVRHLGIPAVHVRGIRQPRAPAAHRVPSRVIRVIPEQIPLPLAVYHLVIPSVDLGIMALGFGQLDPAGMVLVIGGRINQARVQLERPVGYGIVVRTHTPEHLRQGMVSRHRGRGTHKRCDFVVIAVFNIPAAEQAQEVAPPVAGTLWLHKNRAFFFSGVHLVTCGAL